MNVIETIMIDLVQIHIVRVKTIDQKENIEMGMAAIILQVVVMDRLVHQPME